MIVEIIGEVVIWVVGHGTGRVLLSVFHPHVRIKPLTDAGDAPNRSWFAFTYTKDGQKFFHDDSVTFVGLLFWVVIVIVVAVALKN